MKIAFPALFALALIVGVTTIVFPPRAQMQRAVQGFGFRQVHLTGFALFGCAENDAFRQKWSGRNTAGKHVDGVACGGLFKDWTVRLS